MARQECEVAAGVAAGAVPSPTVPEITAQVPAAERGVLYAAAPCLFVTTRILVVDFLGGRLAGRDLAGLLILNAHRVSDACGEAFAARLFRATNRAGSVRGLTDAAPALAADFNRAEKVLKALFVRRVHLWPRFQSQVRADLETAPPEVRGGVTWEAWRGGMMGVARTLPESTRVPAVTNLEASCQPVQPDSPTHSNPHYR